jgi:hypothetical protein
MEIIESIIWVSYSEASTLDSSVSVLIFLIDCCTGTAAVHHGY